MALDCDGREAGLLRLLYLFFHLSDKTNLFDAVKHSVRKVEVTSLQMQEVLSERLKPDEVGRDDHGGGVVGAVVVRWSLGTRVIPLGEPLEELLKPRKVKHSGFNYCFY